MLHKHRRHFFLSTHHPQPTSHITTANKKRSGSGIANSLTVFLFPDNSVIFTYSYRRSSG